MALSKITADSLGANAVTANSLSNTAITTALGYAPANKAGETFTGIVAFNANTAVVGTSGAMRVTDNSSNAIAIGLWDGSTSRIESAGRPIFITSYGGAINLGYSGSQQHTFAANGFVGIGTTSPITTFQVSSGATDSSAGITLRNTTTNDTWILVPGYSNTTGLSVVQSGVGVRQYFAANGNVGFNTSAPSSIIEANGFISWSRNSTYTARWDTGITHVGTGDYGSLYLIANTSTADFVVRASNTNTDTFRVSANGQVFAGSNNMNTAGGSVHAKNLPKAWCRFDYVSDTSASIVSSYNVSSLTISASTLDYIQVNFATAFVDSSFAVVSGISDRSNYTFPPFSRVFNASYVQLSPRYTGGSTNYGQIHIAAYR